MEYNSRNPRDLARNRNCDGQKKILLSLSQGTKKKADEGEDKDDDDVMSTSVSQDRVTVTLCTEELFLCT